MLSAKSGGITRKYWAEADRYRLKGTPARSIARARVEEPILERVLYDLASGDFAGILLQGTRESFAKEVNADAIEGLKGQIAVYTARIGKLMDLATMMESQAPALRRIADLEPARAELERQLAEHESMAAQARLMDQVTVEDVQRELASIIELAKDGDMGIGAALMALVDRVVLDPVSLEARLHYRLVSSSTLCDSGPVNPVSGVKVASPRGFEPRSLP